MSETNQNGDAPFVPTDGTSVDPYSSDSDAGMHTPPEHATPPESDVAKTEEEKETDVEEKEDVVMNEDQKQESDSLVIKHQHELTTRLSTLSLVSENDQEVAFIMTPKTNENKSEIEDTTKKTDDTVTQTEEENVEVKIEVQEENQEALPVSDDVADGVSSPAITGIDMQSPISVSVLDISDIEMNKTSTSVDTGVQELTRKTSTPVIVKKVSSCVDTGLTVEIQSGENSFHEDVKDKTDDDADSGADVNETDGLLLTQFVEDHFKNELRYDDDDKDKGTEKSGKGPASNDAELLSPRSAVSSDNYDTLSDVMEPSPRMSLPQQLSSSIAITTGEDIPDLAIKLNTSSDTNDLLIERFPIDRLRGISSRIVSSGCVIGHSPERGTGSFNGEDSLKLDLVDSPRDSQEDMSDDDDYKIQDILKKYKQSWKQEEEHDQSEIAISHVPEANLDLDDSEIIDDVLAEVDSHNTTATSILLDESVDQFSHIQTVDYKSGLQMSPLPKTSTPSPIKESYISTALSFERKELSQRIPAKPVRGIYTMKQVPVLANMDDIDSSVDDDISLGSVLSDSESCETQTVIVTNEEIDTPRLLGLSREALNYEIARKKFPDDDNKSDSGVSDSTLSKGSLEDLYYGVDMPVTRVPKAVMKNILHLGKYNKTSMLPNPVEIMAYPVYNGSATSKKPDQSKESKPPLSVTFQPPVDESVLEGQSIVNQYAPTDERDQLHDVIKTLEDSVLKETDSLTLKGEQEGDPPTKVPAKVREIITKNLSTEDLTLPEPGQSRMSSIGSDTIRDENRMLQAELNRVEDLLAASRAERDEIGIKYNAVSERLEQALQLEKGEVGMTEDPNAKGLVSQNIELRRKLEDEHGGYKRKLQAYQEGQQRQAQLVQKLQAKVLQYKRKCGDLEETVRSQQGELSRKSTMQSGDDLRYRLDTAENRLRASEADHHMDLETALIKLEEEQQRSSSLAHVNAMLREQLDQATSANQQLTSDIHKLTQDWQRAREELEQKEAEWREEEQSFNEYFSNEHSRLLHLWRSVVAFRRQYSEMKSSTERDMSQMRGEVTRASRCMHSACLNLSANMRNTDTQSQVSLDSAKASFEGQLREKVREVIDFQAKFDAQSAELNARISELSSLNERLKGACEDKDKSVGNLQRTVASLEMRLGERGEEFQQVRSAMDSSSMEREEIDSMHEALRRIAAEVISDADQSLIDDSGDPELSTKVLRSESPVRGLSPSRSGRRTPSPRRNRSLSPMGRSRTPTFGDSTFSAVQAALSKRQLQVSELRAKLTSQKESNSSVRRSLDDVDNERRKLEQILLQIKEERDTAVRSAQDAQRTSDRTKASLGQVDSERSQLERVRSTLNEQIDALSAENGKLQAANAEIQSQRDQLEDEKEDVNKDKDRQYKENERCHKVIEQCETKISKLKEDLVNTKECLNRALLEKDVLEQERCEACEALSRAELCKAELELEINKVKTEEASLRDALLKMQALNEGLGQDKIELNKILMQMDLEKNQLYGEKGSVEQEKFGLKEELCRVEQEKMDVENEKSGVIHTLNLTETHREKLEQEIMGLNRERAELIEQLNAVSRQKNALAEELLSARKEIERQSDTIVRIAKEKEELTRDKAELTVQLTASERENRQQSEAVSGLKADKEALECNLHESQGQNVSLESRKEQLEGENQELILKKEHLQGEIARERKEAALNFEKLDKQKENILSKLAQTEKDLQMALKQEQQAHEEDIERLSKEKEHQRIEMESQRDEIIHQNNLEKEDTVNRYEREKEQLNDELASLQRDRDEQLLMAENDKQQVMSLLEQEKASLGEKLSNTSQNLETANVDYDKLKREAIAKQEGDRNTILNLNSELTGFREQFEETCLGHEKEVKDMNNALRDLDRNKEGALREVAELKVQLKMVEETRDAIRRDLIDANRAIREGDEAREIGRKEIIDLKRNVNEEVHEKEAVQQTAHDLRNVIKKIEGEKTELSRLLSEARQRIGVLEEQKAGVQKEASDLRHSLREVEKARLDARRELQDLRRQVKMLDGERNKLGQEVGELQSRVAHDEQKEEESRRENFGLKQKVVEMDANREVLRKELSNLQRKMAEFEDEARLKEKDYQLALEDSRRLEKKLDDQRRNLEISLENANAELADLKLKLSGSEGRVNALESHVARTEGYKRDIEFKLGSIVSSLRRTIGLRERMPRSASPMRSRSPSPRRSRPSSPTKGFENTYTTTTDGRGSPIPRTGSPDRSLSPFRSMSPSRMMEQTVNAADVDPEIVRASLRDFVQQLAGAERERDDAMAQTRSVTMQLKEMEEDRNRTEARLLQLQRCLGEAEEGKKDIDSRLASAQTALMLQEETIRRNERERKSMSDKISNLERNLSAGDTEKRQLQERIQKMKNNEGKLEEDKKCLRASLDDAENRVTKGELARRSLEGDLQRMKLALTDKETENQVLQDRAATLIRQTQELEDKSQSLQTTLDRLSQALMKSEQNEHSVKDKVNTLNTTLSDSSSQISEMHERAQQLQRALTSSEHDRRVLQERLDNTRAALNEAKKQNHSLIERVQGMQNELSDSEVRRAELETQIRSSHVALVQRQETEQELNQRLQKMQNEKGSMNERIGALQRNLAAIENEKREVERVAVRSEKDKSALKKTLDKVEREKMKHEEVLTRSSLEKTSLDRTLGKYEEDNTDLQRQCNQLQQTLATVEQEHSSRLIDLTTRHRHETEMETERLRSGQIQAERMLEARERAHRQRVKGLEEQIATLKDQLGQEMRKRQQYISRSVRTGEEIADIRSMLDTSLGKVAYDPELDPILLEQETKKLDEDMGMRSSIRVPPRRRSPQRGPSPTRLGRITSTPVAGRSSRRGPSPGLRRP